MSDRYENFVAEVKKDLRLDEEGEKKFRGICEMYGVDWKLRENQIRAEIVAEYNKRKESREKDD